MDNITLETINSSISQLNNRIDDLNKRVDETNTTIRVFTNTSNKDHRDIGRQIDQACRLISNVEKESSLTKQKIGNHLDSHTKDDERMNINGIKITSLIGNFSSAIIGALTVLYAKGIV